MVDASNGHGGSLGRVGLGHEGLGQKKNSYPRPKPSRSHSLLKNSYPRPQAPGPQAFLKIDLLPHMRDKCDRLFSV